MKYVLAMWAVVLALASANAQWTVDPIAPVAYQNPGFVGDVYQHRVYPDGDGAGMRGVAPYVPAVVVDGVPDYAPVPTGYSSGLATCLSADRNWVGGYLTSDAGATVPFRWNRTTDTLEVLATAPGFLYCYPSAIASNGVTIETGYSFAYFNLAAVIRKPGNVLVDAPGNNPQYAPGWRLTSAEYIEPSGVNYIVIGNGSNFTGGQQLGGYMIVGPLPQ